MASERDGWVGETSELICIMERLGADRDAEGRWQVRGTIRWLNEPGTEAFVGEDAVCYRDGEPVPLIGPLREAAEAEGIGVAISELVPDRD